LWREPYFIKAYYLVFERRGDAAAVNGLAFFFGVVFIIEVGLVLWYGVDQQSATAPYIGGSLELGEIRLPYRLLAAFSVALVMALALSTYLFENFLWPGH